MNLCQLSHLLLVKAMMRWINTNTINPSITINLENTVLKNDA